MSPAAFTSLRPGAVALSGRGVHGDDGAPIVGLLRYDQTDGAQHARLLLEQGALVHGRCRDSAGAPVAACAVRAEYRPGDGVHELPLLSRILLT